MAMRKYRIFRQIFAGLLFAWLGGLGQAGTVSFSPSGQGFPNPERGFWYFIADDFADMAQEDANWVRDQGQGLAMPWLCSRITATGLDQIARARHIVDAVRDVAPDTITTQTTTQAEISIRNTG